MQVCDAVGLSDLQNGEVQGPRSPLLVPSPEPTSEVCLLEVNAAPWIPEHSNINHSPAFRSQGPVPTYPSLPTCSALGSFCDLILADFLLCVVTEVTNVLFTSCPLQGFCLVLSCVLRTQRVFMYPQVNQWTELRKASRHE